MRLACGMSGGDKYIEEMNTAGEVGREVGVGGSKARQNANLNVAFPITFLAAQSYEEGL